MSQPIYDLDDTVWILYGESFNREWTFGQVKVITWDAENEVYSYNVYNSASEEYHDVIEDDAFPSLAAMTTELGDRLDEDILHIDWDILLQILKISSWPTDEELVFYKKVYLVKDQKIIPGAIIEKKTTDNMIKIHNVKFCCTTAMISTFFVEAVSTLVYISSASAKSYVLANL